MNADITRVWGRADEFDIEFTHESGDAWTAHVPPDLSDGQYAVEIHAINSLNETAYWTGILYMSRGVACLQLDRSVVTFWLKQPKASVVCVPERQRGNLLTMRIIAALSSRETMARLLNSRFELMIKVGCRS